MTFQVVVSAVLFLVGIGCMVRANLLFREIIVEINRLLPTERAISLDGFARHRFFEILGGYKGLYPDGKLVLAVEDRLGAATIAELRRRGHDVIEAGPWSTSEDALKRARRELPIEIFTTDLLSLRCKRIRRRGRRLSELDPEQLHRLRIQVKKARYATDFFSGVYPAKKSAKQCKKIKSSLTQLQNCLGGLNDIATHKALFSDIITSRAKGLTEEQSRHRAFAAGLIIGNQQAQIQKLRDRTRKAYSRFDGAKAFWKLPSRSIVATPAVEKSL